MLSSLPPAPPLTVWVGEMGPRIGLPGPVAVCRILVAGLGSPEAFSIAAAFPEADVLATDEEPAVIAVAGETARDLGLQNLVVRNAGSGALDGFGPVFDWIHCPAPPGGGDDAAAWRALAGRLAPAGLLTCRMRSRRQEYWGDEFREAVRACAGEATDDLESYLALGARLARSLSRGGSRLAAAARAADARLEQGSLLSAAMEVLPAARPHSLDSIRALLSEVGLRLLGFLNQPEWNPDGILRDPELEKLQSRLAAEQRYELADLLRAPDYLLVCGHAGDRDESAK